MEDDASLLKLTKDWEVRVGQWRQYGAQEMTAVINAFQQKVDQHMLKKQPGAAQCPLVSVGGKC